MTYLRQRFLYGLLGVAVMSVLGMPDPVAAAEGRRETVTVTVRCASGDLGHPPARLNWPRWVGGEDEGRGWAYQWRCLTLRDSEGKEQRYAWVDFGQWGGTTIDLNVVTPHPGTVLLPSRSARPGPDLSPSAGRRTSLSARRG